MSDDKILLTDRKKELQEIVLHSGAQNLRDEELLELLLSYAAPRQDAGDLARRLLEAFGNLKAVFDAPERELAAFEELSDSAVLFLKAIPDITRTYYISKKEPHPYLTDNETVTDYMKDYFIGKDIEIFYLLCLNKKRKLIQCIKMAEGLFNNVPIDIRELTMKIADTRAEYVILAHNHPRGRALPSAEDAAVTNKISDITKGLGVKLSDHFIFSPNEIYSMAGSEKYYHKFFEK